MVFWVVIISIDAYETILGLDKFLANLSHHQGEINGCIKQGCDAKTAQSTLAALTALQEVCNQLKVIEKSTEKRPDLKEKLMLNVGAISTKSNIFGSWVTGASPLSKNIPVGGQSQSQDSSVAEQAVRSAAEKSKIAQAQLDHAQKRADEAFEREMKLSENLMEEISKLAKFNADVASTSEVIGVLRQGLVQLAKLKDRWLDLALFFQGISNLIKHSMGPPLKHLVEDSQRGQNRMTPLLKKMIYGHAYDASKMSFLVNALSSSYLQISGQFFMPLVSKLGILMTLTDKTEIDQKKVELQSQAKDMQKFLEQTLKTNQADFRLKFEKRSKELQGSFDALPLNLEEKKQIDLEVKATVKAITYEDYA